MTRVGILGAKGRMGQVLMHLVGEAGDLELGGASDRPGGDNTDGRIGDNPLAVAERSDVLIDFSLPQALDAHLGAAVDTATPLVIGTTGFDAAGLEKIAAAAKTIPLVHAANYSSGVTLLRRLAQLTAAALDDDYDVEILEAHHRHKQDAPSGTALALGQSVAQGRGIDLAQQAIYAREGITGARAPGGIGFQVIRAGDIVGEHTVMFAADGERLELTHRASSRETFARGALRAARWVCAQPVGHYDMNDVLGLNA